MNKHRPHRHDPRDVAAGAAPPREGRPAGRLGFLADLRARLGIGLAALIVLLAAAIVATSQGAATPAGRQPTPAVIGGAQVDDPGSPSGSPSPSVTPLPPAPAGFATSVEQLYASMTATAQAADIPGAPAMPTTAQFDEDVAGLSAQDLAALYSASQSVSGWQQLQQTYQKAETEAPALLHAAGGPTNVAGQVAALRPSVPPHNAPTARMVLPSPTVTATATENFEPDPTPSVQPEPNCPAGAPGGDYGEDSLFATELAADTLDEAKDVVPRFLVVAFGNADIQDPAELIIGALKFVADVIHATFGFLQSIAADCDQLAKNDFLTNIDNTTFQTWTLLNEIGQTTNETDQNVVRLLNETETQDALQLTLQIESALAAPADAVPIVAFELPASQGGYLDRSPVGVEGIVTTALSDMENAVPAQAVNPLANRTLIQANQALGAGQYKQAWALFRTAYAYIAN